MIRASLRIAARIFAGLLATACHGRGPDAAGVTGPVAHVAGPASSVHGEGAMVTVPIKGTWDNAESPPVANPPAGCLLAIETTQTGNATHLGQFTGAGGTCVTGQDGPLQTPPFWDHAAAPPYLVMDFTNEMVWTAANGDQLWLRPNGGVFVMSGSNGATSVRGHLTIAGGTGRFEGASGEMSVTGGREAGEPGDHLEYEGEITLRSR